MESESHDAGIGIRIEIKIFGLHWNQNWNHSLLDLKLESESWIFENPDFGIRIVISPSGIGVGIRITGPGVIYNSDYKQKISHWEMQKLAPVFTGASLLRYLCIRFPQGAVNRKADGWSTKTCSLRQLIIKPA